MFRSRPEPKPQFNISHSPVANDEINSFSLQNRLKVSDAVIFLEHNRYREETKANLHLKVNGDAVWAINKDNLLLAFTRDSNNICIEWVTLISKFRR
jgi:hypothetical protein